MEHWLQNYDPLGNAFLSTIVAALPVVVLLGAIAFFHIRIHLCPLLGLTVALAIALFIYKMPAKAALLPDRPTERSVSAGSASSRSGVTSPPSAAIRRPWMAAAAGPASCW